MKREDLKAAGIHGDKLEALCNEVARTMGQLAAISTAVTRAEHKSSPLRFRR